MNYPCISKLLFTVWQQILGCVCKSQRPGSDLYITRKYFTTVNKPFESCDFKLTFFLILRNLLVFSLYIVKQYVDQWVMPDAYSGRAAWLLLIKKLWGYKQKEILSNEDGQTAKDDSLVVLSFTGHSHVRILNNLQRALEINASSANNMEQS